MKPSPLSGGLLATALVLGSPNLGAASNVLLGWNDLGMHCMDADYSVFSILPPFNTIHAQFIAQGQLWTAASGAGVTYEAVADTNGSINRTSTAKTDFWQQANTLYLPVGTPDLALDLGLAGFAMPGTNNTPQAMRFDAASGWFSAEGIPLTPYDDSGRHNPYPMMHLVARNAAGTVLASADIVLPVSDEMDCRACHASGTTAVPVAGWEWDCDPQRDYRFNILRVHDDWNVGSATYSNALQTAGYAPAGLYDTAKAGTSILCARCHASNALPGTGLAGVPPLTQAVHSRHALVQDPFTGLPLDEMPSRAACYRCHPGSETRCLRGVMGGAVAADGSRAMDCQSCHGNMQAVGAANRQGWLEEPTCQNCHTGTAVKNSGALRFTSAFDSPGHLRVAADPTFATSPNAPAAGLSLFRFSRGHGGLYCEACHGSTHAEFASTEPNDNVESGNLQGHVGMISECGACHPTVPGTDNGGPHGLHPLGSAWLGRHDNAAENNLNACKACHGADLRGTVLSRSLAARTLSAFGTKTFWRGFQIGCYTCHQGPSSDDVNPNHPAVVSTVSAGTTAGKAVALTLPATDADNNALTLRIVSQPQHGTVALTNRQATYLPDPTFVGTDSFTFAAWDGSTDSNLGTANLTVTSGDCVLMLAVTAPTEARVGVSVPFRAAATLRGCDTPVTFEWSWSDAVASTPTAEACRSFAASGTVQWQVKATAGSATQTLAGVITVQAGPVADVPLTLTRSGGLVTIAWPDTATGYSLESTPSLAVPAWQPVNETPQAGGGQFTVTVPTTQTEQYFRLRKGP